MQVKLRLLKGTFFFLSSISVPTNESITLDTDKLSVAELRIIANNVSYGALESNVTADKLNAEADKREGLDKPKEVKAPKEDLTIKEEVKAEVVEVVEVEVETEDEPETEVEEVKEEVEEVKPVAKATRGRRATKK